LQAHRARLQAEYLAAGLPVPSLVYPSAAGTPLDESNVRSIMRRLCRMAGLRPRSPHDLRHTYACALLQAGAPITYVAAQLGHSSPAVTLGIYARWLPQTGVRYVASLDSVSDSVSTAGKGAG
jgi:integrase